MDDAREFESRSHAPLSGSGTGNVGKFAADGQFDAARLHELAAVARDGADELDRLDRADQ